MTIEDIREIIASDETKTLELKKSTGELKDGMHSACAFLNTAGWWLLFGIAPASLKILGQQVTDNTRQEIAQSIKGLEPAIDVPIEYIEVPDRPGNFVIAMHFDGWKWEILHIPFMVHHITVSKVQHPLCQGHYLTSGSGHRRLRNMHG